MSEIDLYHPLILQHNKDPMNFAKVDEPIIDIEAYNPLCGDQYHLYPIIQNGILQEIKFHGYGCSVSKAASSILTKHLADLDIEKALDLIQEYMDTVNGKQSDVADFQPFSIAKSYPARLPCAVLSWEAIQDKLTSIKGENS